MVLSLHLLKKTYISHFSFFHSFRKLFVRARCVLCLVLGSVVRDVFVVLSLEKYLEFKVMTVT